jgi:hypothetical protein
VLKREFINIDDDLFMIVIVRIQVFLLFYILLFSNSVVACGVMSDRDQLDADIKDLQLEIKMTQKLIKASDQIYLATAKETYENQNTAHFEVIDTLKGESKSEFLANWNDSKTIIGCQSSLGFNNIDIQEDEIYLLYIVNNQLHRASEWKSGKEGLNFTHEILLVRQELSIK